MNNKIKGFTLTGVGLIIIAIITGIFYHLNSMAIWISESIGATPEAGTGIQIVVAIIAIFVLFSTIVAGIACITFGLLYFKDVTPFEILNKLHKKFFGKMFDDDDDFFNRF
ncbi:hypothetical protein KAU33_16150 [Candidatus Dependentiae bacterium]|nr:hypothetical protein [Candidatus Dependentiae bacterium]